MEKQIVRIGIVFDLDWDRMVEIKKIRQDLDDVEKLGATHIDIESGISYDSPYIEINAITERLETDEECKVRVDRENRRLQDIKAMELKQLEKLKAKYEI